VFSTAAAVNKDEDDLFGDLILDLAPNKAGGRSATADERDDDDFLVFDDDLIAEPPSHVVAIAQQESASSQLKRSSAMEDFAVKEAEPSSASWLPDVSQATPFKYSTSFAFTPSETLTAAAASSATKDSSDKRPRRSID